MQLLTSTSALSLWQDIVKHAENRCDISLEEQLESYLVALLARYTNQPEVVKAIMASEYLNAMQSGQLARSLSMQFVGDQCLLFAGLFPHLAEKRRVKISYYVDLGRTAYTTISTSDRDLYNSLAVQFVVLMDVLQSIREPAHLLPLEAYELWNEVGSQRAYKILQAYTAAYKHRHDS